MYIKREYLADTHKHSCRLVMTICTPFGKHLPAFLGYLASMRCDSDLVMRLKFALCGRISINSADSRWVTQKTAKSTCGGELFDFVLITNLISPLFDVFFAGCVVAIYEWKFRLFTFALLSVRTKLSLFRRESKVKVRVKEKRDSYHLSSKHTQSHFNSCSHLKNCGKRMCCKNCKLGEFYELFGSRLPINFNVFLNKQHFQPRYLLSTLKWSKMCLVGILWHLLNACIHIHRIIDIRKHSSGKYNRFRGENLICFCVYSYFFIYYVLLKFEQI